MREKSREPESFCKVPGPGLSLIYPACINKSDRKTINSNIVRCSIPFILQRRS